MRSILIDTDPGHDDALAMVLAARHCEIVGITTVAGNQSIDKVTLNARKVLDVIKRPDIPLAQGSHRPLVKDPVHAPLAHGESGMDGVDLPAPIVQPIAQHAVEFLIDAIMARADLTLVTLGPLTNVANALRREPRIASRLREISMMGGSTTLGNVTPAAEFNFWFDPEAAHIVFESGVPIRMVGLNLTHQVIAGPADYARIAAIDNAVARFCRDLLVFYGGHLSVEVATSPATAGVSNASKGAWHDPCAIACLIDESLIEFEPMHVAIELKGRHTYGMSVCDARHLRGAAYGVPSARFPSRGAAANAQVGIRIDRDRFFDLFVDTLKRYG